MLGSGKAKVCRTGMVTAFMELKGFTSNGETLPKDLAACWAGQAVMKGSGFSVVDGHWWGGFRGDSRIRSSSDQTRCFLGWRF